MKRLLSLIIGVTLLFASTYALAGSPGSKGAVFLKLGQGARSNGMGESFSAVADDINALYWNPAGIAQIEEKQATFMYSDWLAEIKYNYLGYVHSEQILGGIIGGAITLLDSGSIPKYDITSTNEPINLNTTYEGKDIALAVSYAREMLENCSLGATLKYIKMKIDTKTSSGFGLDVGCLYRPQVENLTLSTVVQNFGPELKAFVKEKDGLPLNFKVGGAYKLLDNALTLSLDVNFPSDNKTNFNFGTEYWIKETLAIRAGYKTLTKKELRSSDLTFGMGIRLPIGIGLDYAYCDYGDLDDTHRVSLITKF